MIYLDANIFVYPHTGIGKKSSACIALLEKVTKKELEGGTSVLTWNEVQHSLKRELGKEKGIEQSKILLTNPGLTWLKATKESVEKAQEIVEKYNLNPRDAIHAATALLNNIKEIASDDSDFDKVKELKRIKI